MAGENMNEKFDEGVENLSSESVEDLSSKINTLIDSFGLEAYPFKIGWYNDAVQSAFRLPYDADTIAFAILSVPKMFEQCLVPFVQEGKYDCLSRQDPLDQCMKDCFQNIKDQFKEYNIEEIHDYEVHPNRRPKILVQTCGHISGAAYYYQQDEVKHLIGKEKLYGVSVHPKYGGWFAFRGFLVFKNVVCPSLVKKDPEDVVKSDEMKVELLRRFNNNWKDWSYRDIIEPTCKYSEKQKLFFSTPPSQRQSIIESFQKS